MKPESLLTCSKDPAKYLTPDPDDYSPHLPILFLQDESDILVLRLRNREKLNRLSTPDEVTALSS